MKTLVGGKVIDKGPVGGDGRGVEDGPAVGDIPTDVGGDTPRRGSDMAAVSLKMLDGGQVTLHQTGGPAEEGSVQVCEN